MNTNITVKRILVFGDSNTWGQVPGQDHAVRFHANKRWTGILQNLIGSEYEILEEGLNGRTTNTNSPDKAGKNGKEYLFACLESQNPIDLIILALGKNDLKRKFDRSPQDIALGLRECVDICIAEGRSPAGYTPKIIIVSTAIVEEVERSRFGKMEVDFLGAKEKSIQLVNLYFDIANEYKLEFVDISKDVLVSPRDGVHLEENEHKKLGEILYKKVKEVDI